MPRRVVAIEGKRTMDGRLLKPGSITIKNKTIPVTTDGYHTAIGKATDFERNDETGEISLDIITKYELPDDINAHISLFHLVCSDPQDDKTMVIESGTLVGVFLSLGGSAWPELSTKKETNNE